MLTTRTCNMQSMMRRTMPRAVSSVRSMPLAVRSFHCSATTVHHSSLSCGCPTHTIQTKPKHTLTTATIHTHHHAHLSDAGTASPPSASAAPSSSSAAAAPSSSSTTIESSSTSGPVRVRYAPSPTGSMHLGGLRTALYNYLFSKHVGGSSKFLIRVEDTDQRRLVSGAVDSLLTSMNWAGLHNDEGPGCPDSVNTHGPYVQSERLHLYREHIKPLLASGDAYPCFCSANRLEELREQQLKKGLTTKYDRLCLNMTEEERQAKLKECEENGIPYVIRMKIPSGTTVVKDMIRGSVSFPNKTLDDQVLLKSDGFPTYHFACIVDDHLMDITHVIRGEEWLTSTPKHVMLYKMMGWNVPQFAHLPLLLKPDGTKLSKRHADSSLEYYIEKGYLPQAVINFVAMLGWNPGTTQEIFSMSELIASFNLERIQKAGAVVNLQKLDWFNQQQIQLMAKREIGALIDLVQPMLRKFYQGNAAVLQADLDDKAMLQRVIYSLATHVTHVHEFVKESTYAYLIPQYHDTKDEKLQEFKKRTFPDQATTDINLKLLASTISTLESLPDSAFALDVPLESGTPTPAVAAATAAALAAGKLNELPPTIAMQHALKQVWKAQQVKQKQYFLLLRYALTGSESGPSISVIISTLGRERALQRLKNQAAFLPK